jgi:hypothetical protein
VLPERVDVAIAADLLYSEELAVAVARTGARLVRRGAALIVTDSQHQWSGAFAAELACCLGTEGTEAAHAAWSTGPISQPPTFVATCSSRSPPVCSGWLLGPERRALPLGCWRVAAAALRCLPKKSVLSLRLTLQAPAFEQRALGAVTGWSYGDGGDATYDVTVGVLELDGMERGAGEANLLTTAWYSHF